MKWYVLNYDFNAKRIENFNIFQSIRFSEGIDKLRNKIWNSVEDFKEAVRKEAMYSFWSKAEYEIMIGDLFETDCNKLEKWDVYDQILPNLEQLCRYILNYWANNPRQ